jgi:GNAT superfamily N-acetyltransferase
VSVVEMSTGRGALSILPIVGDDLPFVREMLYEAAFWRGTTGAPPLDAALRDPALAIYVEGWGRPGDEGLLARLGGTPVGAVWVRRFRDDAHGYGYVDERTPELSIAVAADHRGCGLGRCLVTAMLVALRCTDTRQVSLSVETDNPARLLYERLGFEPRTTTDGAVTMVRTLGSDP